MWLTGETYDSLLNVTWCTAICLQVREGVRTLPEVLALARAVEACPALRLRGVMTHHGKLEVFAPIVAALRANVSQARLPQVPRSGLHWTRYHPCFLLSSPVRRTGLGLPSYFCSTEDG